MTAPSDVETLREAARVLRERAEAATDSVYRWQPTGEERVCEVWAPRDAANYDAFMVATTLTRLNRTPNAEAQADADHIAAADPTWCRTVADLYDALADGLEARGVTAHMKPAERQAITSARVYLRADQQDRDAARAAGERGSDE